MDQESVDVSHGHVELDSGSPTKGMLTQNNIIIYYNNVGYGIRHGSSKGG